MGGQWTLFRRGNKAIRKSVTDLRQIIFFRQSITVALSLLYMWSVDIPKWPLGPKHVRKLLFSRAFGGFFGGRISSRLPFTRADACSLWFLL